MKKLVFTLFSISLFLNTIYSQDCNSVLYNKSMKAAADSISTRNYLSALKYFDAAEIGCKQKKPEIIIEREKLFSLILELTKNAENSAKETKLVQKELVDLLKIAQQNNDIFMNFTGMTFSFLSESKLNQKIISWVKKNKLDNQLDSLLIKFIDNSKIIETQKDRKKWYNIIKDANNEKKAELFELLGKTTLDLVEKEKVKISLEIKKIEIQNLYVNNVKIEDFLKNKTTADIGILLFVADSLRQLKKDTLAIEIYKKNLELNEKHYYSLQGLLYSYYSLKNYQEAYNTSKLITIYHENKYVGWFNFSFFSLFVKNYPQAIKAAEKTLNINPKAIEVEANLALGYLLNDEYEKAEKIYRRRKGKLYPDKLKFFDEIFLQDIKDLEEAKITSEHFQKVKDLINN